jgi:hypothetical protein
MRRSETFLLILLLAVLLEPVVALPRRRTL